MTSSQRTSANNETPNQSNAKPLLDETGLDWIDLTQRDKVVADALSDGVVFEYGPDTPQLRQRNSATLADYQGQLKKRWREVKITCSATDNKRLDGYASKSVLGILEDIEKVQDGPGWNPTIYLKSGQLAGWVALGYGFDSESDAKAALLKAAAPWNPKEERAAKATIKSGWGKPITPRIPTEILESHPPAPSFTGIRAEAPRQRKGLNGNMFQEGEGAGEDAEPETGDLTNEFKRPRVYRATDLKAAAQPRWLARRWIPRAAPTVFCGDEGIGKSLYDIRIIAAVTTGTPLPDIGMPNRDPQRILMAAITEEDWSTIVLPRLIVAGADLDMIDVICTDEDGSGPPVYPRDFDLIRALDPKPALIVVDSWLDTLAMDMVVRDSQSAAAALKPWTDLATATDAGIILLTPTNRMGTSDIRDRYGVTQHLRKKARATIFGVRDDDTDLLVVGPDKSNNASAPLANLYRVEIVQHWEPTDEDDGTVGKLEYVAQSDRTIRQWVSDNHDDRNGDQQTEVDKAAKWLHDYLLREQPIDQRQVKLDADAAKIKPRTLRRARQQLRVITEPIKGAVPFTTTWRLP